MTRWQDSPSTVRKLAAAYALGTLAGPARRRFEAVLSQQADAAEAVAEWNRRFASLAAQIQPAPAQPALWARIEQAAFAAVPASANSSSSILEGTSARTSSSAAASPVPSAPRVSTPVSTPPPRSMNRAAPPPPGWAERLRGWFDALLTPVPAAALAAGLALGLVLPAVGPLLRDEGLATELPESYVGVLATADGRPGMIVSSLRRGLVVDLKRVVPVPVPADRELHLWVIDAQGRSTSVGAVPDGAFVRVKLAQPAEEVFTKAVELGLTLEPRGSRPTAPGGAYVYRGLCGKLWRVQPAR